MHRQPECHRDPRESIFKWNLKEVVGGEKKSKEASMAEQNPERERRGHERTGDRIETILNIRKDLSFYFERERKTQLTTQPSRRNEYRGQGIQWKIMGINNPGREDADLDLKAEPTNSPDDQMWENAGKDNFCL